ncbi:MAG: quinolinate synthase NadA, partial [Myxococcota bacterium]|nr:quinolinate synthase NadA [Myxococcota bacterium]
QAYGAWLQKASTMDNSIHIIYINTSLRVKALSHVIVPTITCTSSNVLHTILQAAAQIPELNIWYGPDTYMGANLKVVFEQLLTMDDTAIQAIHPQHNLKSIQNLLSRFHFFQQGNCVVHHMFGADVVEKVRKEYGDAYHTAHFEVPGEMFELASQAQKEGRGVVGSTSNILHFIADRVQEAKAIQKEQTLSFVLGTEAGMITSIVRKVQHLLQEADRSDIQVEIIFPVASEAVTEDAEFGVVPGVSGGEGCSTAGGCATCPYMKMNSLDAMFNVIEMLAEGRQEELIPFFPQKYTQQIQGRTAAEIGGEPILFMRHFQRHGVLPDDLVEQIHA